MSRVGRSPIVVPANVTVEIDSDGITVRGPKGELKQTGLSGINVVQENGQIVLARFDDEAVNRSNHGLLRSLIDNMITGVVTGFTKKLEVNGVGYRVALAGSDLRFNLGYSHDVTYRLPVGVTVSIEQNIITVSGINKQQVGQVAAGIRSLRKPEPYKGKGIKYVDERIVRKSGKSGKEKTA
jgi:large subunit ribosomal protein L6